MARWKGSTITCEPQKYSSHSLTFNIVDLRKVSFSGDPLSGRALGESSLVSLRRFLAPLGALVDQVYCHIQSAVDVGACGWIILKSVKRYD